MGLSPFNKCSTNYFPQNNLNNQPIAPNPNPERWVLLKKEEYPNGYILEVKYLDCTNFEGIKLMVYKGKYTKQNKLDPHFYNSVLSPIARFRPTIEGWSWARALVKNL